MKKRRGEKSRILTETPGKHRLEEIEHEKCTKENKLHKNKIVKATKYLFKI